MRDSVLIFLFLLSNQSCKVHDWPKEDVFKASKDYCNCLDSQLSGAKDSTVNLNDCVILIFSKSRLLSIYSDFNNWDSYEKKTLDSAKKFAIEFRNITDTLCYNKIDFKKVKKIRQL